ncbi:MAG: hypothetical protein HC902_05135 [Calothrix sp. SM1_5_4]|nr:hypothetical protein [Calothrix sp. SM1_5_4]
MKLTEAGYAVQDYKSRTGVLVNEIPLPPGKAAIIRSG